MKMEGTRVKSDDLYIRKEMDDPYWECMLKMKLKPYIRPVRDWWSNFTTMEFKTTGILPIRGADVPPGLYYRCSSAPIKSPIRGIQAFPFVSTSALPIFGVKGGVKKMIARVCQNDALEMDGMRLICKDNIRSVMNRGQIVAFIPAERYDNLVDPGVWMYFLHDEIDEMLKIKKLPEKVRERMMTTLHCTRTKARDEVVI